MQPRCIPSAWSLCGKWPWTIRIRLMKNRLFSLLANFCRLVVPKDRTPSMTPKGKYILGSPSSSAILARNTTFEESKNVTMVTPHTQDTGGTAEVLAPIMEILHLRGIYISPYLDDFITKAEERIALSQALDHSTDVLLNAGFVINIKKSRMVPTQDLVYVGG